MTGKGLLANARDRLLGRRGPSAKVLPMATVHSLQMRLDVDEGIQSFMAKGLYEPEQTEWARECLSEGDRFVDVGANFGWYTTLASTLVGRLGKVFAFEPSPVASGVVADTIRLNGLKNITLTKAAVGDAEGSVEIYMPVNDTVHSPSVFFSNPDFVRLKVPVISLDRFASFQDGLPLKLIKIDVEGYEPNVIRGMHDLVERKQVHNLFCEFNSGWLKRNGTTPAELRELVMSYGFAEYKRTELQVGKEANGDPFECHDVWFKLPS